MKDVLVINGPNLSLLGEREPGIYGSDNYAEVCAEIKKKAAELGFGSCECFQSNHEGDIIDRIHAARRNKCGIILNAGAYTHYSYAIRDAISAVNIPVIEVHVSNIYEREEFRHNSVIAPVCSGSLFGFGTDGYLLALHALAYKLVMPDGENRGS